ncbi:hypothetical protein DVU_1184 [Nitratidesulfovibrio vulgaris str. Hildenborough]|uniref:Uncharacterized protein n=1 Tax=Nitratidesulfovibrio vulgaris (strain ATCC 29579 / DSM 644 / CCUG 34227 / NCIMB 8303 / VKM B-1760 / Hildenborough) TaxID=882 RepID=Q72CU9_NITV2|nr:hypothetical protein DVU_1184 [Nitratidesulfovibrio vulgaris str. Hildenborough]
MSAAPKMQGDLSSRRVASSSAMTRLWGCSMSQPWKRRFTSAHAGDGMEWGCACKSALESVWAAEVAGDLSSTTTTSVTPHMARMRRVDSVTSCPAGKRRRPLISRTVSTRTMPGSSLLRLSVRIVTPAVNLAECMAAWQPGWALPLRDKF